MAAQIARETEDLHTGGGLPRYNDSAYWDGLRGLSTSSIAGSVCYFDFYVRPVRPPLIACKINYLNFCITQRHFEFAGRMIVYRIVFVFRYKRSIERYVYRKV